MAKGQSDQRDETAKFSENGADMGGAIQTLNPRSWIQTLNLTSEMRNQNRIPQ